MFNRFDSYGDDQLAKMWNDGDGSISYLNELENELEFRGYTPRSTDPDDGRERLGGERCKVEPNYPMTRKHREGKVWICAKTQAEAEDYAEAIFGYTGRSKWAGSGHYRSDVYIVEQGA